MQQRKLNKKVAVIIPTHNVEKYILECLRSIESQTYKNIITLIVDDNSDDKTCDLIEDFIKEKDNYLLIKSKEKLGASKARNIALDRLESKRDVDFILFVDSDDIISEKCICLAVENCILNNSDICIFGHAEQYTDKATFTLKKHTTKTISNSEEIFAYYWNLDNDYCQTFISTKTNFLCNRLYSRHILQNLRFRSDLILGEDQIFLMTALLRASNITVDNYCAYIYRQRASSVCHSIDISKKLNPLFFEFKKVYRELILEDKIVNSHMKGLSITMFQFIWDAILKSNHFAFKEYFPIKKRLQLKKEALLLATSSINHLPKSLLKKLLLYASSNAIFKLIYRRQINKISIKKNTNRLFS